MSTTKDPEVAKLAARVAHLEKVAAVLLSRVQSVERENKRLRGAVGRTTDQISGVERRIPKGR